MFQNVNPLPVSERIATLDIVRGFALLGILIMNMPGFSTSFFAEADGSHISTRRLDLGAEMVRDMLFSGKFNSMFSLLFGIGFTIQLGRLMDRRAGTGQSRSISAASSCCWDLASSMRWCSGRATCCTSMRCSDSCFCFYVMFRIASLSP